MQSQVDQRLEELGPKDVIAVAEVHRAAFPGSALTVLGAGPVRRYYEWLITGPHEAHYLGIRVDEVLAGFCICGRFRGALTGFVRRNAGYLAMQILLHPRVWIRPKVRQGMSVAMRLLGRRRKPAGNHPARPAPADPSFGTLALAVLPEFQGRGIGGRLMEEAASVARAKGFRRMHLTVSATNERAIRLYKSQGWEVERLENASVLMTRRLA